VTINEVLIADIHPYENNPRKNKKAVEAVAASIKEFGFKVPIVLDRNNIIVAGHTRYEASKKLGLKTVPCIIASDLSEEQVRAYRLADNKTAELADWDFDLLKGEIDSILGIDMSKFGFDMSDTDSKVEEDDYWPQLPAKPKSKAGDIYQLGRHRLMCGDSTSATDVAALMDGNLADVLQTDPPYNVDYGSKAEAINKYGYHFSDRRIENDYMPSEQFIAFLDEAFHNAANSMKPGAAFYIWHANITVFEFEFALRLNKMKSRQQIIWNKNAIVLGRQDYQWKHEPCLYGWKEGAAHYFVDDRKNSTVYEDAAPHIKNMKKDELIKLLEGIYSDKMSTSVMNEDRPSRSDEHPTMKPLKLLARQILNSSKPGGLVLDLFGGSGSTIMASEQIGRTCYMMELDPKYIDVVLDRYEKLTGTKPTKIKGE